MDGQLQAFYANPNTWAKAGSYNFQTTISGTNTPIMCTTTDLSGRSDQLYQFDVHIGLKPDDAFKEPKPKQPVKAPLLKPQVPAPVAPGDKVTMPGGGQVVVVQGAKALRN